LLGLLDLDVCGRVTLLLIRGAVASMMFADSCCRFFLPLQNEGLLPVASMSMLIADSCC
jgi:hypothetical protein